MSDIVRNGPSFNKVLSVELDIKKCFHQFPKKASYKELTLGDYISQSEAERKASI